MPEQPPAFVVVDKRKFTLEGEMREGVQPTREQTAAVAPADDLAEESMAGSVAPLASTLPQAGTPQPDSPAFDADGDGPEVESDLNLDEDAMMEAPSAEESAAQATAYQQSASHLDAMLQEANPGMKAPGAVGFEHLVQSFYLSAVMAMGAGTQPGQQPRIDILGARQAIDLLGVLAEKTQGNLTPDELQLLQGVTFELRMSFLELTNAISRQAMQGPPPGGAR